MSFGKRFGQLIRRKRDIEGLSQQDLAAKAFGDEERKSRISELENGHVARPQSKTVDALVVALNISEEELNQVLNDNPHPGMVDTLVDFFDASKKGKVYVEVAVKKTGEVYIFYDCPMKYDLHRLEYFVEDKQLVFVTTELSRRPFGLSVKEGLTALIPKVEEIRFCKITEGGDVVSENAFPLKIVN